MNIPQEANSGEVYAVPNYLCQACQKVLALDLKQDAFVGSCACGHVWFIPVQRAAAYLLTAAQLQRPEHRDYLPPATNAQDARVDHQAAQQHVHDDPVPAGDSPGSGDEPQGRLPKARRSNKA